MPAGRKSLCDNVRARLQPCRNCGRINPASAAEGRFFRVATQTLKRYYGQGHLHFITFSCYRHLPLLKHPGDWPWSSWGFYWGGAAGLVTIDVEE
jgi:hypothetical protein